MRAPLHVAEGLIPMCIVLQLYYIGRLRTAISFDNVKFYGLAFFQCAESICLNGREMDKHIISAFPFDKSKTFFCVKPFYSALHENSTTLSFVKNWDVVPCV